MLKLDRFSCSQKIWLKWDPPVYVICVCIYMYRCLPVYRLMYVCLYTYNNVCIYIAYMNYAYRYNHTFIYRYIHV